MEPWHLLKPLLITRHLLKALSLNDDTMDEKSAMIIMKSRHHNDTITGLSLCFELYTNDSVKETVIKINRRRFKSGQANLYLYGI